jgi:hypothetical protein
MEHIGERFADEAEMPRLKNIISIIFWIGKNEAVFVSVGGEPRVAVCFFKRAEIQTQIRGAEINRRAELMFGITLVGGKFVGATAIINFVTVFERALLSKRTVGGNYFQIHTIFLRRDYHLLQIRESFGVELHLFAFFGDIIGRNVGQIFRHIVFIQKINLGIFLQELFVCF